MCEFCTKHGEGKKWYLQMKNYAGELLHERAQRQPSSSITQAATRLEWNNRFWQGFVMPAISGVPTSAGHAGVRLRYPGGSKD